MLYLRMLLTMGVSLYTVRIVLGELGVEDYGIYNVVGGIVALFSFLTTSMSSATQRFFSFAMGSGDHERLRKTFSVNLVLYGSIALLALLLLESLGFWFVREHLRLPPERAEAAQLLFHLSVATFLVRIFSSPFVAIILAHEEMHFYALTSVGEALARLGAVTLLMVLPGDKLVLYGFFVMLVASANTFVLVGFCLRRYDECQVRKLYWDAPLLWEVAGFTGWTLFGHATSAGRMQGITILLNQFFNPVVVAGRAVATSVATQVNIFSTNFNAGLYPPIIKSYAAGELKEMYSLIFNGAKITFFLMWILALPLFLEMETVLGLWLRNPPPDAVFFTRLAMVEVLIMSVSLPVATAARAPGKMKIYESILGGMQIALFLLAWVVLHAGFPPFSVYVVAISVNLAMFFVRLLIVGRLVGLPLGDFFRDVGVRVLGVAVLSAAPCVLLDFYLPDSLLWVGFSMAFSFSITLLAAYYVGLDTVWRQKARTMIRVRLAKILGRRPSTPKVPVSKIVP